VVIGILALLFLPHTVCGGGIGPARRTACASNLRQLYQLGTLYSSTHQGEWPAARGSALWRSFTQTSPPLLEQEWLDVLSCPVKGEELSPGACDYLGPRQRVSALKPTDALGADKPGNHGEGVTGNLLLRDGSVQEYEASHPLWESLSD